MAALLTVLLYLRLCTTKEAETMPDRLCSYWKASVGASGSGQMRLGVDERTTGLRQIMGLQKRHGRSRLSHCGMY